MAVTKHSEREHTAPDIRRTSALVAGDLIAFHLVTAIGLLSHGELTGAALGEVVQIAAPFAAGWFVVAPFLGAYKAEIVAQPRRSLARVALAWLIALPIGLVLWSVVRQKTVQPAFAIVTFITNLIVLLGWRGAFALVTRGRSW